MKLGRAAILLEIVLSLAIFIIAGGAVLNLVSGTAGGLAQSRNASKAADLARSAMAKIEAGIDTPQTLNGPIERQAEGGNDGAAPSGWELEIETDASQFRGLTRVQIRAVKHGSGGAVDADFTLIQLVRLGSKGEDKAGASDPVFERATKPKQGGSPR